MKDQVVALLERLPVLPEAREQIEDSALRLVIVGGMLAPSLEMSWSHSAGTDEAKRSLRSLTKKVSGLLNAIDAIPREAFEALDDEGSETAIELRDKAKSFLAALALAEKALETLPPTTKLDEPTKLGADAMTNFAAKEFTTLTGNRPTVIVDKETHEARGPWVDLVKGLFLIFDIDASPVAQARKRAQRLAPAR